MTATTDPTSELEQMKQTVIELQKWAEGTHALLTLLLNGPGLVQYPFTPPPPTPPRRDDEWELGRMFRQAAGGDGAVTVHVLHDNGTRASYSVSSA